MIKFLINKFLNRENIKYIVITITIILGVFVVIGVKNIKTRNKGVSINSNRILEKLEKNKIAVYLDGEVNNVGYIKVNKGATLEQAINKSGGITKKADIQNIDLKRVLKNQEKIIIPAIKEEAQYEGKSTKEREGIININIATKEELMILEGIGEKTAENIILYRKKKGFGTKEEVMGVKGIGKGKFEKIKGNICT